MQRLSQKVQVKTLNHRFPSIFSLFLLFFLGTSLFARSPQPELGKQVFHAAGGCGCHTDTENGGIPLAGRREVRTPFGSYYGTNITPDPLHGIGSWSDEDFIRAMTEGLSPDGKHYFPAFPYTSFTRMKKDDLLHLKDYLFSLPAVKAPHREHDAPFPFNWRGALSVWKKFFFKPAPFKTDPDRSESWNRGAYISEALAHCGECHTPRSMMGALDSSMHFAGSPEGPEGELSPNITQDRETGIGEWSRGDLTWLLKTGMKPGGDDVQGLMAEAIENGYRHLTDYDLEAIAEYLESVPPVRNDLESEKKRNWEE